MKCEQIREILETLAPVAMACEWDNPGFQVCRWEKEINSIYLAVDATDEVIAEAKELKADMILTHHPLIFGGIKNILTSDFIGRRIYGLAQQDMVYCAMHTNFDICVMADLASDYLELMETEPLEVTVVVILHKAVAAEPKRISLPSIAPLSCAIPISSIRGLPPIS